MSATKGNYLEFAKAEFVEQHGDLILELADHCGKMAGQGDMLGLTIFFAHIDAVFRQTMNKVRELQGDTGDRVSQ